MNVLGMKTGFEHTWCKYSYWYSLVASLVDLLSFDCLIFIVKKVNPNNQTKQNQNGDKILRRLTFNHYYFLGGQVYLQPRMVHCQACWKDIDVALMGETESALQSHADRERGMVHQGAYETREVFDIETFTIFFGKEETKTHCGTRIRKKKLETKLYHLKKA